MPLSGRQTMLNQISAGIAEDEIEYLITTIGVPRIKRALQRVMNTDEASMNAREKMPASLEINGMTYWRQSE